MAACRLALHVHSATADAAATVAVSLHIEPPPHSPPALTRVDSELEGPECAICMNAIAFACLGGGCAHHFCAACMLQCRKSSTECPKCRAPLGVLCLDSEYDALCGGATRRPNDLKPYTASFQLERGQHAGITLSNTPDGDIGVRVSKAKRRDAAYQAGIREGDILVWLNGQPCRAHHDTVELIDKAKKGRNWLNFVVLPRQAGRPPFPSQPAAALALQPSTPPAAPTAAQAGEEPASSTRAGSPGASSPVASPPVANSPIANSPEQNLPAPTAAVSPEASPAVGPVPAGIPDDGSGSGDANLRVCDTPIAWVETAPSVVSYALRLVDSDGEWTVSLRYSRWRVLFEHIQSRWPSLLQEMSFPPKAMPAYLKRNNASPNFYAERAAGLEAFVRGAVDHAHRDDSGMCLWLHFWLRRQAEGAAESDE